MTVFISLFLLKWSALFFYVYGSIICLKYTVACYICSLIEMTVEMYYGFSGDIIQVTKLVPWELETDKKKKKKIWFTKFQCIYNSNL